MNRVAALRSITLFLVAFSAVNLGKSQIRQSSFGLRHCSAFSTTQSTSTSRARAVVFFAHIWYISAEFSSICSQPVLSYTGLL